MRELSKYTSQDLKDELIRRSKELELNNRPKPIDKDKVDLTRVYNIIEDIIESVIDGVYYDDDDNYQYLYEAVITSLYGEGFFDWFSKNT